MTNGECADRLYGEARQIAGEMKRALEAPCPACGATEVREHLTTDRY